MSAPKVTLTREQLYEKVWSTPMQKLAAEFGFSDRGLAKLCRRHKIPVPPRGYWARLQAGQRVQRKPLPPATQTTSGTVEICAREQQPRLTRPVVETQGIPMIPVAEGRPLTHPISLQIEKLLSDSRMNDMGLLVPNLPLTAVPIQVSAEQLPRALRICDALLEAFDRKQYSLSWPKPHNKPLTVAVLDEPLTFMISEAVERRERKANASRNSEAWWHAQRWDYRPTGRLKLAIRRTEQLGLRCWWSDGKKRRVEDSLGEFLVSLVTVANALKRQREEHAEWERRRAEERKREAEQAARRAEHERRAKAVEGLARSWEHSKSLLAFAERLSLLAGQEDIPEEQRLDIRAMAEWAMRHAQLADPFTHLTWMIGQFKNPPWSYGH